MAADTVQTLNYMANEVVLNITSPLEDSGLLVDVETLEEPNEFELHIGTGYLIKIFNVKVQTSPTGRHEGQEADVTISDEKTGHQKTIGFGNHGQVGTARKESGQEIAQHLKNAMC